MPILALECAVFGGWRGRGALGRGSSRECRGREDGRAGGVLDALAVTKVEAALVALKEAIEDLHDKAA
jgi:hypothetical protein